MNDAQEAAERVLAYLDVRTRQSNHDPEILSTVVGMDETLGMPVERHLYAGDLRELAAEHVPSGIAGERLRWVGVIGYVGVRTTDGRTLLPPSQDERPFARLPLPVTVSLRFPWPSDLGVVVGEAQGASIIGEMIVASGWVDLRKLSAAPAEYLDRMRSEQPVSVGLYLADVLAEGWQGSDVTMGGWTAGGLVIRPEHVSPFGRPCHIRCY